MKTNKPILLIILSTLFILGCSCCGITFPFLQGVPTPTTMPFFTSIPVTQTQPSVDQIQIIFMADRTTINSGDCAMLQWAVQGPAQVIQLDDALIPPMGQKQVCPTTTTTYTLMAGMGTPQLSKQSQVIINVSAPTQTATVTVTPTKLAPINIPTATKTKTNTPTITVTSPPPPPGGGYWGPAGTDVQVVDVGASSTTGPGYIYIDIKNNGPKEFNGDIEYVCQGTSYMRANPSVIIPVAYGEKIHINISIGTGFFPTKLAIDPSSYSYPVIQCVIVVPDDPEPSNNSGTISIP